MIDAGTREANFQFAKGDGLHGIAPIPGKNILVTTNRGHGSARILSASDGSVLGSISLPDDADGAQYDPETGLVIVICGSTGTLLVIDPGTRKEVGRVQVKDRAGVWGSRRKGPFFVNLEEKIQVAMVDLRTRKVIARYDVPGCEGPTGLAYVIGDRVISECANGNTKMLNAASGNLIAQFQLGGFPDAVL